MSDRRIDDRRLGRSADLRKIRKQRGKILKSQRSDQQFFQSRKIEACQESAIESLSTLSFDCVVSCAPFSSVGSATGFPLDLCNSAIGGGCAGTL
jgi:hypothetical protein